MSTAASKDQNNDRDGTRLLKAGYSIAAYVVVVSVIITGLFVLNFSGQEISKSSDKWGQFGDYVGGTINPIVGLATVLLVLINIRIQRQELRSSLAQLELSNTYTARQSFEQSLFAWLGNYHELLASIRLPDGACGRAALTDWFRRNLSTLSVAQLSTQDEIYGSMSYENPNAMRLRLATLRAAVRRGEAQPEELHAVFRLAMHGFRTVYRENRSDLDALFRTLYRLIHWIDNTQTDITQRRHYVSLVRAQLSWIELVYLLFNGLTHEGEKFAVLCNKYALFDNFTAGGEDVLAIICEDLPRFPPSEFDPKLGNPPWPYTASAFSSDAARAVEEEEHQWGPAMFSRGNPKSS